MRLLVILEHRFLATPDGAVWTQGPFGYSVWSRYLDVFDGLRIAARVAAVPDPGKQKNRADGPGVSFAPLPYYVGPWQYLRSAARVQRGLAAAMRAPQSVLLRTPSHLATCAEVLLRRSRQPFGVFVTGDPYDALAPGAIRHKLRGLFRCCFRRDLRRQCRAACSVAYVTEQALQNRYPALSGSSAATFSDVELAPEAFVHQARAKPRKGRCRLVWVGGMDHLYKAPDILLNAMAQCLGTGLDVELTLVGAGRYQSQLEAQALHLGIAARTRFRGQLASREEIWAELDHGDLFVLPSRQEGLPRAMLEAMARALPVIGSTAGGIPELLPPEDLVPIGDTEALASRMREVLLSPERLAAMSARNLVKAQDFREDVMRRRRNRFLRDLRGRTQEWMRRQE